MTGRPLKIGIIGVLGRMGQCLVKEIVQDPSLYLAGGVVHSGLNQANIPIHPLISSRYTTDDLDAVVHASDIVIDATTGQSTSIFLDACAGEGEGEGECEGVPILVLATSLDQKTLLHAEKISKIIPIFLSENTSIGAFLMIKISHMLTTVLSKNKEWSFGLLDIHHKNKEDRLSGTARAILKNTHSSSTTTDIDDSTSLRIGSVVGEHILFCSNENGEEIRISHKVFDRSIFAKGAIDIVKWLFSNGKESGIYKIGDIISI